uniref:BD-FAE-like domain-containing protein n=1 Tax=Globisporangium ultimum (strain ATCC 200006 / CBS 805.95 / DAOM BR144) TaxID=431595 RepID=K3WGF2_GLOUD
MGIMRWRTQPLLSAFGWKDVAYSAAKHPKQRLDIAVPRKKFPRRKLPTCVFIHGGSWQRGDKAGAFNNGIDDAFVNAGCIGVSVNYRLSPEVQHPEHTLDVATAVKWYGGDPNRLVLIGHSAGAHLVMQLLADPQFLRQVGVDEDVSTFVKGAVGISGVYNIVRMANASFYGSLVTTPAFGERVDQWREASVITALTKERDKSPLVKIPLLLLTAEEDFHFSEDAQELETWLVAAGHKSIQRKVIPKRNHFTILRDLTAHRDDNAMQEITKFIQSLVKDDAA